jgi:ParB family chromosome partitioning protein
MNKRIPPKVSGLIKNGKIGEAPNEVIGNMPAFAAEPLEPQRLPANSIEPSEASPHEIIQKIPVERIRKSRFQNRVLISETEVADLADNISKNGLNSPILVRALGDGDYELITGETRLRAFIHNQQKEIPAVVREMDDIQASRSTIYDNIFHRQLTDYEVYKGFKMLLDTGSVASIRALGHEVGYSKSHVHRMMAFGKLPGEGLALLDEQPNLIGCNVAEGLAVLTEQGDGEWVVAALNAIKTGKLNQTRAVSWVRSHHREKSKSTQRVLTGPDGKTFCTLFRDDKCIRVRTVGAINLDDVEEIVYTTLKAKVDDLMLARHADNNPSVS